MKPCASLSGIECPKRHARIQNLPHLGISPTKIQPFGIFGGIANMESAHPSNAGTLINRGR